MKLYSLTHHTLPSLPLSSMAPNRPWVGTSLWPRGWGPLLYSVLPLEVGITGSKLEFLQIGTFSQLGHASCTFFQKSVSLPIPTPTPTTHLGTRHGDSETRSQHEKKKNKLSLLQHLGEHLPTISPPIQQLMESDKVPR